MYRYALQTKNESYPSLVIVREQVTVENLPRQGSSLELMDHLQTIINEENSLSEEESNAAIDKTGSSNIQLNMAREEP